MNSSCWLWTGSRIPGGYGNIRVHGKKQLLHRHIYEEWIGPIPKGTSVLHHCDNPSCINPEHLFLGTQKDNQQDSIRKGRFAWGSRKRNAKFIEQQIKLIRQNYRGQYGEMAKLARQYNVAPSRIFEILKRRTWKHVA